MQMHLVTGQAQINSKVEKNRTPSCEEVTQVQLVLVSILDRDFSNSSTNNGTIIVAEELYSR